MTHTGTDPLRRDSLWQLSLTRIRLESPPLLLTRTSGASPFLRVFFQTRLLPSRGELLLMLLAAVGGIGVKLAILVAEFGLDNGCWSCVLAASTRAVVLRFAGLLFVFVLKTDSTSQLSASLNR